MAQSDAHGYPPTSKTRYSALKRCTHGVPALLRAAKQYVRRSRCQAIGGPRAWKGSGGDAASSPSTLIVRGVDASRASSDSEAAAASAIAPAIWISVQTAQLSWTRRGFVGSDDPSGSVIVAFAAS